LVGISCFVSLTANGVPEIKAVSVNVQFLIIATRVIPENSHKNTRCCCSHSLLLVKQCPASC